MSRSVDDRRLLEMAEGYRGTQMLCVAVRLGVMDHLRTVIEARADGASGQ